MRKVSDDMMAYMIDTAKPFVDAPPTPQPVRSSMEYKLTDEDAAKLLRWAGKTSDGRSV